MLILVSVSNNVNIITKQFQIKTIVEVFYIGLYKFMKLKLDIKIYLTKLFYLRLNSIYSLFL